jgi:hypothetical protein
MENGCTCRKRGGDISYGKLYQSDRCMPRFRKSLTDKNKKNIYPNT